MYQVRSAGHPMIDHATISIHSLTPKPVLEVVKKNGRLRAYIDRKKGAYVLKRLFDIGFSLLFIILVLSWLMPLLMILIRIGSKGPSLFRQKRVGLGGRSFICYKFRTMVVNDEADLKPADEADQRITRIGAFLRKSNIDEFPQFLNVLMGSMSIVGPRPHMYADCYYFSLFQQQYKFRNMVKPGLTGLAQVKGFHGPALTLQEIKCRYEWDQYYIRHFSLWLDIKIIAKTIAQRIWVLFQYIVWKSWRCFQYIISCFEQEKLLLRARKYRVKEDKGGIGYILRSVKNGDTVFDIGSHKGGYLHFLMKGAGAEGQVYAFEPQSLLYRYLFRLKKMLHWKNVVVEPFAVSDAEGNAMLYVPWNHGKPTSPGASLLTLEQEAAIQKKEKVKTITLDRYCHQQRCKPDFLKIDVEGNELAVLRGAVQTLKTYKPKLLLECEERFVGKAQVTATFRFLEELGYRGYFIYDNTLMPISGFSTERFQQKHNGFYCNNFVFEC